MSVFAIKLAAMISMLIDHCAYVLAPPHYFLLRCIGRIAFPLYCFLIVNGLEHTHDRRRYLARLLIFAAISQLPFAMAFYPRESIFTGLNVFFTLAAGLAFSMLCASRSERDGKWYAFAAVTLLYAAAVLPGSDYGFGGAALIFLLYICRQKRALQVAALWLWCLWQYALELGSWEMFAFAAAAAIPMLLYNGRRGPGLKWLFYGFYPAHLPILGLYACGIWPWAA